MSCRQQAFWKSKTSILSLTVISVIFFFLLLYSPIFRTVLRPSESWLNLNLTLSEIRTHEARFRTFKLSQPKIPAIPEEYFVKPRWENKYIIYDCRSGLCGGLGDREEGVVAAYIISQMLGRKFGLFMTQPCDIGFFLEPNKVDWIVTPEELLKLSARTVWLLDESAWAYRERIVTMDLEAEYTKDVIYFMVNQDFVQYLMKNVKFQSLKWAQNKTAPDIYNIVLHRLFKLKTTPQYKFSSFQMSVRDNGRKLVCAHIRMRHNPTLPRDWIPPFSVNVSAAWNFLAQYNNSALYRIFVATDAEHVRLEARRLFPDVIADIDGRIVHVDQDYSEHACDGFGKVILDQLTMSTCDIFLMTDSGLGRIGAMLRGTDADLYFLQKGVVRSHSFSEEKFFPSYW